MMVIDNKFNIGETVFLKTDTEQSPRIVTSINVTISNVTYSLNCGAQESWHYDFEITTEKNVLITSNN